jgi:hypothetical protein
VGTPTRRPCSRYEPFVDQPSKLVRQWLLSWSNTIEKSRVEDPRPIPQVSARKAVSFADLLMWYGGNQKVLASRRRSPPIVRASRRAATATGAARSSRSAEGAMNGRDVSHEGGRNPPQVAERIAAMLISQPCSPGPRRTVVKEMATAFQKPGTRGPSTLARLRVRYFTRRPAPKCHEWSSPRQGVVS